MLSKVATVTLTMTAMVPVTLVYGWVAILRGKMAVGVALFGICLFLAGLCCLLWKWGRKRIEKMSFRITSAAIADEGNVALLFLYVLPLLVEDSVTLPEWKLWIPIALIIGIAIATSYSYHHNPLLGVLGWHWYRVGTEEGIEYVLISRRQLRAVREELTIGQLTEYVLVDLAGE